MVALLIACSWGEWESPSTDAVEDTQVAFESDVDADTDVDSDADTDPLPSSVPGEEFWTLDEWTVAFDEVGVTSTGTEAGADAALSKDGELLVTISLVEADGGIFYAGVNGAELQDVLFLPAELRGVASRFDDGTGGWSNTDVELYWCGAEICALVDSLVAPDGHDQVHVVWRLQQGQGVTGVKWDGTWYR